MYITTVSLKSKYKIALFRTMPAYERYSKCLLNELMNNVENMYAYGQRSRHQYVKLISCKRIVVFTSFKVTFNLYIVSSFRFE